MTKPDLQLENNTSTDISNQSSSSIDSKELALLVAEAGLVIQAFYSFFTIIYRLLFC